MGGGWFAQWNVLLFCHVMVYLRLERLTELDP
jgi:hypothetical protein